MPTDARIDLAYHANHDDSGVRRAQRRRGYDLGPRDCLKTSRRTCMGSTSPGMVEAEEGVRLAYRAAGLSPPRIVWCRSPRELAHAWAAAASGDDVGPNVGQSLVDRPCRKGLQRIQRLGGDKAGLIRTLFGGERSRAVSDAVQAAVIDEAGDIRPWLLDWMNRSWRSGGMRLGVRPTFATCGYGPRDLCAAGLAARVEEALGGDVGPALRGLRSITGNVGWLVPHEAVCWLSLHPDMLSADRCGRLHCGDGPALRYPDGWSLYAWKGTPLPAWIITHPEKITLPWIDAQIDPRIRHAMIDIFTPARFIAAGGAHHAASDESGALWKRKWTHRGTVIDAWAAVQAAGPRQTTWCVSPNVKSPTQAFAWLLAGAHRAAPSDVLCAQPFCQV
jgi:hypothetical protein